ncbi:C4-dicarboxylate ABC transporter substrate-binding protein [Rhodobacteraceae bacterium WD3A24]|nr:C4-dicarboxylate ABC transporter substrate-binding protein [Rhodobacteraceae bacterium WD3A24]
MLDRLDSAFTRIFAAGAALCMAGVFLVVFVNSLRRYTLNQSWAWGEEMPIYLSIYGVMFGVAMAYMQDRHIRFTLLTDPLPARARAVLFAVVDVAMIAIGGLLVRSGLMFIESRGEREASGIVTAAEGLAGATGMSWLGVFGTMAPWQFAIVLGGALLALAAALRAARRIRDIRRGEV